MSNVPRVLVDFDGVIHKYSRGWDDGTAYDEPMPGAKGSLQNLTDAGYEVVIFSTRERGAIYDWLKKWGFPQYLITNVKLPAICMIDDRAIRFDFWAQAFEEVMRLYPISKESQ